MAHHESERRSFRQAWLIGAQEDLEREIDAGTAPADILAAMDLQAPNLRRALKRLYSRLVLAKANPKSLPMESLKPGPEAVAQAADMLVAYAETAPIVVPTAFISYSSRNATIVDQIVMHLKNRVRYWLDAKIKPGEAWAAKILERLRDSQVVVIVITAESLDSDWVRLETGVALGLHKTLIPAIYDAECPRYLADFQAVDLGEKNGFQKLAKRLARLCPK